MQEALFEKDDLWEGIWLMFGVPMAEAGNWKASEEMVNCGERQKKGICM